MRRRDLLGGVVATAALLPLIVAAQQLTRPARIGYLAMDLATGDPSGREIFIRALRDLGYVEGRNLVVEYRDAGGKPERSSCDSRQVTTSSCSVSPGSVALIPSL